MPRTASTLTPQDDSLPTQQAEAEALFSSIGDGAISTDEFGKITRVNPVALQLLGYRENEPQQLIGEWFPRKIIAVTPEDTAINLIDRPITKAFLTGRPVSAKTYYRRRDGRIFPVSVNVSPILLDGRPLGAIEVFRDISLEEEVDRMKSDFISLASHQLRTPLSAIKTYSHMLVDGFMGPLTTDQKKSLRTIIRATNRMNELISTLLNITRLESGTFTIVPKNVHLDQLSEEAVQEATLAAADKSIHLNRRLNRQSDLMARTDPIIVKEILANLLANAIKYTPDSGRVSLTLTARSTDILITVSDTGWGIPKQAQDQIFSKFFRAQNIIERETTGTGLGLYLVKGLVEAVGGTIWFDSRENTGTTFYFELPRHFEAPQRAAAAAV
jgi:PAS domain S-box-containing protein